MFIIYSKRVNFKWISFLSNGKPMGQKHLYLPKKKDHPCMVRSYSCGDERGIRTPGPTA